MSAQISTNSGSSLELHSRLITEIAATKSRESFSELFLYFVPRLKTHLMRMGADAGMAEELAQEALLAVWRKAESFDPARAAASTWIFTIARNLWIDHIRRARRKDEFGDPSLENEPPEQPDEISEAVETARSVRDALDLLSPEQLEVVRLSFFDGTPHSEIARQLSIPLGTVKSRIRLGCGRLRALLEDQL
jgi:RNA polymerase sigma-70 factor (ECF subfamily)